MTSFTYHQIKALSRLAFLKGQVVSCSEFESNGKFLDPKILIGLPSSARISMLWLSRFLLGVVRAPEYPFKSSDFPLLWVPLDGQYLDITTLVVVDLNSNGELICLDENGKSIVLRKEGFHNGSFISLDCYPATNSHMIIDMLEKPSTSWSKLHITQLIMVLISLLFFSLSTLLLVHV